MRIPFSLRATCPDNTQTNVNIFWGIQMVDRPVFSKRETMLLQTEAERSWDITDPGGYKRCLWLLLRTYFSAYSNPKTVLWCWQSRCILAMLSTPCSDVTKSCPHGYKQSKNQLPLLRNGKSKFRESKMSLLLLIAYRVQANIKKDKDIFND